MTDKIQTSDLILIEQKQESLEKRSEHYFQIDFLKAVMIFLVIFDHIVHWDLKSEIGVALWERICIPVFLVIMGFNMGLSFKRHGANTLRELYSWRYFKSKILRYIVPFLILYAFSTLIGLILYQFNFIAYLMNLEIYLPEIDFGNEIETELLFYFFFLRKFG